MTLVGCQSFSEKDRAAADLHLQIGATHFEKGNFPYALKELLLAESLDPKNPLVQNNLGLVYFVREKYPESAKHFQRAVEIRSDFSEARNNLGRTYIELKDYSAAEKQLLIVLGDLTYPGTDRAQTNFGILKFHQKKYAEAKSSLNEAIKMNKENCLAHNFLGRTLFEEANYSAASEALDRAIRFCQKNLFDEPHYYSALSWYRGGDKSRALTRLKEVVALYPDGKYRDKARSMIEIIEKGGISE